MHQFNNVKHYLLFIYNERGEKKAVHVKYKNIFL